MNMKVQKGLRKRKSPSFSTKTYDHTPKLKPIGELMPKLLEVIPNVGDFKELEKTWGMQ